MKHAILVLAHNNFRIVSALIDQFDAPEFDIYLHINANVSVYPDNEWKQQAHYAGLYFVPRVKVGYCDYSMVEAVHSLLRTASENNKYDYYHLVSGADLLIKRRSEFLDFFEKNNGKEFVGISQNYQEDRVLYRHYFTALGRQQSHFWSARFISLRKFLIRCQERLGLKKRILFFPTIKKGTDWYSITDGAVRLLLEKEPVFRRDFYRAYCPTEFFPHTVLYNSSFQSNLFAKDRKDEGFQCQRLIDWNRGQPYVFTMEDREFLLSGKEMFARKFDENKDMEIVDYLKDYVKE